MRFWCGVIKKHCDSCWSNLFCSLLQWSLWFHFFPRLSDFHWVTHLLSFVIKVCIFSSFTFRPHLGTFAIFEESVSTLVEHGCRRLLRRVVHLSSAESPSGKASLKQKIVLIVLSLLTFYLLNPPEGSGFCLQQQRGIRKTEQYLADLHKLGHRRWVINPDPTTTRKENTSANDKH